MSQIKSDHVVKYINTWIDTKNNIFIQMELCSDNLKNIIEKKPGFFVRTVNDVMSHFEYYLTCIIFKQIIECVDFLHNLKPAVIHRDLKPANILFDKHDVSGKFFKLCDFGLAKLHDDRSHTTGMIGTMKYMAPEIFKESHYDTKCDIYSLGVIGEELFEINTSRYILQLFIIIFI